MHIVIVLLAFRCKLKKKKKSYFPNILKDLSLKYHSYEINYFIILTSQKRKCQNQCIYYEKNGSVLQRCFVAFFIVLYFPLLCAFIWWREYPSQSHFDSSLQKQMKVLEKDKETETQYWHSWALADIKKNDLREVRPIMLTEAMRCFITLFSWSLKIILN